MRFTHGALFTSRGLGVEREEMSAPAPSADLFDLRLLPAWVKEPSAPNEYAEFAGEEMEAPPRRERRPSDRGRGPARPGRREQGNKRDQRRPHNREGRQEERRPAPALPAVTVRFLPQPPSLENVIAQIKSGSVAYSLFALARLFLEKPERYIVRLHAPEQTELFQLGEHGPVSTDRRSLEASAFDLTKEDFYKIDIVQSDPIKGNFTNVARCRASGTHLGPTNHHAYQAQLRNLYEQRFSRRMSFVDYQRQIEIVTDPAAVEQWKEQARNITTYTTTREETPLTFNTSSEAERHFRQHYLPGLVRAAREWTIGGVLSRRLPDRGLGRVIENAWSHETRSPSGMMQELAGALRQAGLHVFRHRRGMLFVSPIRLRSFKHELTSVSPSVAGILEAVTATPRIHRKELADKLIAATPENADAERLKMSLASDLKWLISSGYVIEFNDGSLDLPRVKTPNEPNKDSAASGVVAAVPAAEPETNAPDTSASTSPETGQQVGAIDPIARGRFGEPPLPQAND